MPHRLVLTLAVLALACFAEEDGPHILRPVDQSVFAAGPVSIIVKGTAATLDGKPLAGTSSPAPGVLTAELKLAPGKHELAAGDRKVRFFVGSGAPVEWKPFRMHPPAATCQTCHAVKDGAWEIKGGVVGDNCFTCHDRAKFPPVHQHNTEVLADCQLCHYPHGSNVNRHLKFTKNVACKQCHG